jgi:soluble lytic murein transglycosylase-like protein
MGEELIDEERAMPRIRPDLALCALLAAGLLSACSTSGGLDAIAPTAASLVEEGDPTLPDTVAAVPTPSQATTATAVVAEAAAEEIDPTVVASAYAGPTVENAAAAAIRGTRVTARSPELDSLIARYAAHHQIPEELLRRVVKRESTFNPAARNGPYWGLMQILPATARTMGYSGSPSGLLDAETNLKYAGRYLRGAYLVADGNHDLAVRYYSRGYYYDAKRRGMLDMTGLGKDRRRMQ